jgi:hypothetical protein
MNSFLRNSLVARLILALLLAGGALTIWGLATGMVGSAYLEHSREQDVVELLRITSSGQPVMESWRRKNRDAHLFTDLEGRPVTLGEVEPRLQGQRQARHDSFLGACSLPKAERYLFWPQERRYSIRGLNNGGAPGTNWFLLESEESKEHAYLEGYDQQSKQCVGYVGVGGFRLDKPPMVEQFAIGGRSLNIASLALHSSWGRTAYASRDRTPLLIISDDKLYLIDLEFATPQVMQFTSDETRQKARVDRTVRQLPIDEPVLSMDFAKEAVEAGTDKSDQTRIAVRTTRHVLVLDMAGKPLRSVAIPPALVDQRFSVYFPVGDQIIFAVNNSDYKTNEVDLTWVNTEGAATRSEHAVMRKSIGDLPKFAWLSAAVVPSPAVLAIFYYELLPALRSPVLRPVAQKYQLAAIWNATWPTMLLIGLLSAAAAVYTYRRQKRYGPRGAVAWAIFVLIVGPAGLLGYLWHRRWPVLEHCASCGADAPRDRGDCVACHTEFPAPRQLGCEVFA